MASDHEHFNPRRRVAQHDDGRRRSDGNICRHVENLPQKPGFTSTTNVR